MTCEQGPFESDAALEGSRPLSLGGILSLRMEKGRSKKKKNPKPKTVFGILLRSRCEPVPGPAGIGLAQTVRGAFHITLVI